MSLPAIVIFIAPNTKLPHPLYLVIQFGKEGIEFSKTL